MNRIKEVFVLALMCLAITACDHDKKQEPQPTKDSSKFEQPSPVEDTDLAEESVEGSIANNPESPAEEQSSVVVIDQELSKDLTQTITAILPLGTYYGHLDDDRSCKVVVEPLSTEHEDFLVSISTDPEPSQFYFMISWTHPLALSSIHTIPFGGESSLEFRLNVNIFEPVQGPSGEIHAMVMNLSIKTNPDGSVSSIYIHNQTKNESGEALALCRIESYSKIIESSQ